MNISVIFMILVAFAHITYGQKQLSIVPALGLNNAFCYSVISVNADAGYGVNKFDVNPSFDLILHYKSNNRWEFFTGWQAADNTALRLKYGVPKKDLTKGMIASYLYTNRYHFGMERNITTCKWLKSERRIKALMRLNHETPNDDILYLILFRLNIVGGININHIVRSTYENTTRSFSHGDSKDVIIQRNSISLFTGIKLQFFNFRKDRIQLSIIYNQGLSKIAEADFNYTLRSGQYYAKVGSRGSNVTIQLGYPIRLFTFKPKSESTLN